MIRVLRRVRQAFTIASAPLTLTATARAQGTLLNSSEVVTVASASSFDSTVARLERAAVANGLAVAAKIGKSVGRP